MENTDLLGAHLKSADLSGASLSGANLRQADLTGAELQYSDLGHAQGLSRDALTRARNWCNAFLDPEILAMMELPSTNADRVQAWRKKKQLPAMTGALPKRQEWSNSQDYFRA
jgi:hypothetical protein